jgi:5-methylcytosine-specific restriction enzyme subunit McrC
MTPLISVREFARLTTAQVPKTLDQATVPESAFNWLCQESARLRSSGAELVQLGERRELRLDNYVGVLETPCGTRIEIVPKYVDEGADLTTARRVLRRMLLVSMDLTTRQTAPANIEAFDGPVTEWIIERFLSELDRLLKRGLRFEYRRVAEEQRFIRGSLDVARQIRQPPTRRHLFQLQHDVFEPDRPENRLLRSALDIVCAATRLSSNWRIARKLISYMDPVPPSSNFELDFRTWRNERLTAHYTAVKPWCALILSEQVPLSVAGRWRGPSFLFPMERVFERYVERCLRTSLVNGASLTHAPTSHHLCQHGGSNWFQLEPDFLIQRGAQRWVLDAKWKRLNGSLANSSDKYGLSQHDLYQVFAYGHKYLGGRGSLFLIYPKTADFPQALPPFHFSPDLTLWAVPFDLERGTVIAADIALPLRGSLSTDVLPAVT